MSISSDGILCFGVLIPDDVELPWNTEEYDYDFGEWWQRENGFEHKVNLYAFSDKPEASEWAAYIQEKRDFDSAHPEPVEVVWHCSYDYPSFIIAVPGTKQVASRGYPEVTQVRRIPQAQVAALLDFCAKYGIYYEGKPEWWLASMYG